MQPMQVTPKQSTLPALDSLMPEQENSLTIVDGKVKVLSSAIHEGSEFSSFESCVAEVIYPDGRKLKGSFYKGEPWGEIEIEYSNGDLYVSNVTSFADVKDGKPNGYGAFHLARSKKVLLQPKRKPIQVPANPNEHTLRLLAHLEKIAAEKKEIVGPYKFYKIIEGNFINGKLITQIGKKKQKVEITRIPGRRGIHTTFKGAVKNLKPHGYGVEVDQNGKKHFSYYENGRLMSRIDVN